MNLKHSLVHLYSLLLVLTLIFLSSCDNKIKGSLGISSDSGSVTSRVPVLNKFSNKDSSYYISSTSHSLIWSIAQGQADSFQVKLFGAGDCQGTVLQVQSTVESQYTFSGLQDGNTYSIQVMALSSNGNSDPICSNNLIVDLQAPSLTITVPAAPTVTGGNQSTISWTASDLGVSGLKPSQPYKVELFSNGSCSGSSQSTIEQGANSYLWSALVDGIYSVRLTAFDQAGNSSTPHCTSSITIDNSLPTLSLSESSASVGYSRALSIDATIGNDSTASKWCLSESQTTAPANGSAICNGGSGPSNGWYMSRPSGMTLSSSDGLKQAYLWIADSLDQLTSTASTSSIILDRTEPTSTCSGLSGPVASASVTATSSCSDATSGCTQTECRVDAGSWQASCSFGSLSEAAHTIEVRGTDGAGNLQTSSFGSCSFTVDVTPPTATLSGTPSDPSSDAVLNVTVGGTGVVSYRFKVGESIDCNVTTGYSSSQAVAVPITSSLTNVGAYTLCVLGKDSAGNEQSYPGTIYSWNRLNNLPPVISLPNNLVFPLDGSNEPTVPQTALVLTATATDPESNTPITWPSCVYETVGLSTLDPNYAASGTSCSSLYGYTLTNGVYLPGGAASFSNGTLTWIPSMNQRGTYKFTLTAQDSLANSSSGSFFVTVRENYSTTNLVAHWDSLYSLDATGLTGVPVQPRLDGTSNDNLLNWLDLKSLQSLSLALLSTGPWTGTGTYSSPYALTFNGSSNYLNLGTLFNGWTRLRMSTWFQFSSLPSGVIWSNVGSNSGLELRQGGTVEANRLILLTNPSSSNKTYREEVMADSPTGYWKFDESARLTAPGSVAIKDISGANYCYGNPCDLEYPSDNSQPDLGQTSVNNHLGTSIWFDGGDDGLLDVISGYSHGVKFSYSDCSGVDQAFTLEAWINLNTYSYDGAIMANHNNQNVTRGYVFGVTAAKKLYMRLFEMDDDNKRIGRLYNTALTIGTWYHVVMTYSGSKTSAGIKLYLNGTRVDDTNDNAGTYLGNRFCGDFTVGRQVSGSNLGFKGYIDEPAVYTGELSSARILAHYNAGVSNNYLVTRSEIPTNTWNKLEAYYDGSVLQLYLNGALEDSTSAPGGWNLGGATAVHVGNSSDNSSFWSGLISSFKLFASSDGSNVGSTAVMAQDFAVEANRFRSSPIENIVTSHLILHLDAANADWGMNSYAANTGCSSNYLWKNLAGSWVNGWLDYFDSCSTYGWKGNGTAGNPYRLHFDGVDSGVWLGDDDRWSFTNGTNDLPFTMETWVRISNFSSNPNIIAKDVDGSSAYPEYYLWFDSAKFPRLDLVDSAGGATGAIAVGGTTALSTNTWYHFVATYNGSESSSGVKIFINGVQQGTSDTSSGTYSGMGNHSGPLKVGRDGSINYTVNGDISIVRIYDVQLTTTEILQNCHAQKNRFSGSSCATP